VEKKSSRFQGTDNAVRKSPPEKELLQKPNQSVVIKGKKSQHQLRSTEVKTGLHQETENKSRNRNKGRGARIMKGNGPHTWGVDAHTIYGGGVWGIRLNRGVGKDTLNVQDGGETVVNRLLFPGFVINSIGETDWPKEDESSRTVRAPNGELMNQKGDHW